MFLTLRHVVPPCLGEHCNKENLLAKRGRLTVRPVANLTSRARKGHRRCSIAFRITAHPNPIPQILDGNCREIVTKPERL
jgi:hypothetical protein